MRLWAPSRLSGKEPPANAGDAGPVPGLGRPCGERNGYLSRILAWRIPWTEEPGGPKSMRSQKAEEVLETKQHRQKGQICGWSLRGGVGKATRWRQPGWRPCSANTGFAGCVRAGALLRAHAHEAPARPLCLTLQKLRLEEPRGRGGVCWKGRCAGGREETRLQFLRALALSSPWLGLAYLAFRGQSDSAGGGPGVLPSLWRRWLRASCPGPCLFC